MSPKKFITWELREEDIDFFARELDYFIPDKVYDIHAHLYRRIFWRKDVPVHVKVGPPDVSLEIYQKEMQWILTGREIHGLHFPFPPGNPDKMDFDIASSNTWVSQEIKKDPLARGQFLVTPEDDPEWVRQEMRRLGLGGLKPFASFAKIENYNFAELPDYLPECLMAVANEEGWTITIHLVRPRGIADQSNIHWVRTYCEKYPHANIILDHVARGFNPYHAIEGFKKLTGLANLWIDTSANCSSLAMIAALRYLGPDRVLYGSDFFCSHIRGINIAVNDTFLWLDEKQPVWDGDDWTGRICPTLIGLENLRAVKSAFDVLDLGDKEIEKYFWGNAASLLDL